MEIYVVQQGDTVDSIAQKYGIEAATLISDNGILTPYQLVVGQTLVITYPAQVYTVKEKDTLAGIAAAFHVTVMQLLRNNPKLANRKYIYPSETLIISYNNNKGNLRVVGYTYPFIGDDILKKTLPYLTFLLIFNYQMTGKGELLGSNEDLEVIQIAKLYETASTMVLTSYSRSGEINLERENELLLSEQIQDKIIENLLNILKEKGYNGVNLAFQFINTTNQQLYYSFLNKVSNSLHSEGYTVFLTVNPGLVYDGNKVIFEKINYTEFSNISDGILFLSYDWGSTERSPIQISIVTTPSFLEYIVTQVSLDKIRIGLPTLGYDWQLPFVEGLSKANALNFDSVLTLATEMNAEIEYDENTLSAYFEYTDALNQPHIVWFKDARSIDTSLSILQSYGIKGIGIWNIMYYFSQMWLVINTQYEIEIVELTADVDITKNNL
jgi:spore germination protein